LTGKNPDGTNASQEERDAALSRCAFKKWYMDNENCCTNIVGNSMYNYHPLSQYPGFDNDGRGYRTSVYGFPCLVFHKHSTLADK
jgi:hypothetical protein